MAARFGEMLLDRRRSLGLSIQQVANTIKIRPQIIEFFEQGNFASMPPRGYAQGMISTYARFLGLNPRQVVNAYFDELLAYERETSQRGGRFQDAAGYVNTRSSTENGRFLMIEGGRSSRYGQRPQQAGYMTESGSGQEIREQRDRFRNTLPPTDSALPQSLGNVRDPRAGYGDGGYSARCTRLASSRGRTSDTDITRVPSRSGSGSRDPYATSHNGRPRPQGRDGRSGVRDGGAPTSRNRQQARGTAQRGPQGRAASRGRAPQPHGPQFDQRIILAGIGVIAVLLILVIFLLMRGCTPSASKDTSTKTVAEQVASGSSSTSSKSASSSDATDDSDSSDTSSKKSSKKTEDTVTKVKVSVAKGKTAWIEIKVDGKSVYGAQATGPFEQEFTPESSIEITTSKPSDVTVTKNGEKVRYDTKTSGVARVTITVPKKSTDSTDSSDDSDSSSDSTDGTDAQSSDGSSTDGTDSSDSATSDGTSDGSATSTYSSTGTYSTTGASQSSSSSSSTSTAQYQ